MNVRERAVNCANMWHRFDTVGFPIRSAGGAAAEQVEEEFCRAEPKIRFGMASGGEFMHTFTNREARQAGLPKNWQ